ncbi:hypothetical protein AHMF7616_00024 [Adhaeribacter pallidiroseus]|uniref:Uncharacterized protein n=1 Tax=Adhaeribacter pallidiroseus TaxID=2072847 RepID=A0A369QD03_9BACT|nr:hypothetical protein AHMF7616_00024 [Adhaeribacter pallidiroseus]
MGLDKKSVLVFIAGKQTIGFASKLIGPLLPQRILLNKDTLID